MDVEEISKVIVENKINEFRSNLETTSKEYKILKDNLYEKNMKDPWLNSLTEIIPILEEKKKLPKIKVSKYLSKIAKEQLDFYIINESIEDVYDIFEKKSSFESYNIKTAQILLTEDDFSDRVRYLSLNNVLDTLLKLGVVPVINQNDTVSTIDIAQEDMQVCFSDNDKLSALVASELDAVFYSINCSDLVSKFMGDSSKRVDILFEEAQKNERAAIFFDEFDSLAGKRDEGDGSLDKERNNIVSTFLTNIDGFRKAKNCKMLLLIAATNRPWAIDSAMMRGGRFSTKIYVGLPDHEARMFLLEKEFKGIPMDAKVKLEDLSTLLDGYGCGDIIDICQKIRNLAYRRAIGFGAICNVTPADVAEILEKSFPSSTDEDLERFEEFRTGGKVK